MKKRINIMTSCDDRLTKYILPQLVSIDKNHRDYDVHFYLAHSRVFPKSIQMLKNFAQEKTNITFHEVKVTKNISFYESLVRGCGGRWPREAYFPVMVQDYMPEDVDRVMYIDAGDVIIDGNISPYYFDDFEGKSIIATLYQSGNGLKINPVTKERELYTKDDFLELSDGRLFNSGSYVINVDEFRKAGYSVEEYMSIRDTLVKNAKPGEHGYFGDQGFMASAFVGDVKFFGYPQYKDHLSYAPYNFESYYFDLSINEMDYRPVVIHYAVITKPWVVRFPAEDINIIIDKLKFLVDAPAKATSHTIDLPPEKLELAKLLWYTTKTTTGVTPYTLKLAEIWWKYAIETPIYDEVNTRARIAAESWVSHYLPMCIKYREACSRLEQVKRKQADSKESGRA